MNLREIIQRPIQAKSLSALFRENKPVNDNLGIYCMTAFNSSKMVNPMICLALVIWNQVSLRILQKGMA